MRTGITDLPLHSGRAPHWLFKRMVKLVGLISDFIIDEFGVNELLSRLSNPFWFQSLGCLIGFDWHSSGLTTTTTAALKQALSDNELINVCGGKGLTAINTPLELRKDKLDLGEEKVNDLIRISRLTAKIDNACIQDGYKLYHHTFVHTKNEWVVIQQGMNNGYARRYQWYSQEIKSLISPHNVIGTPTPNTLDMTSPKSSGARRVSVELISDSSLLDYIKLPVRHSVITNKDLVELKKFSNYSLNNYEDLLLINGFGLKKIRALALISELVYGEKPSWSDPAIFSYAHGGKDGYPYPVNKGLYDDTIITLKQAITESRLGLNEKKKVIKRLLFIPKPEVF